MAAAAASRLLHHQRAISDELAATQENFIARNAHERLFAEIAVRTLSQELSCQMDDELAYGDGTNTST